MRVILLILTIIACAGCARDHLAPAPNPDAGSCTWRARDGSVVNEGEAEDLVCVP